MATLTPILTATPGNPLTYNVGMAETFSWIPVENDADRPIYARATYITNVDDIKIQLSASSINVMLDELDLNTDNVEELLESANFTLSAFRSETKEGIARANTLLHQLTANTDGTEGLISNSNTLLNSLTSLTKFEFNETQTLLNSLTALQEDKQNRVITLLHQLTANTDSVESLLAALTAVDFATVSNQLQTNTLLDTLTSSSEQIKIDTASSVTLLSELTSSNIHVAGFNIPPYDEINLEYEGTTNYLRKVSYSENTTEVLALSFVYATEPPTDSDNRILKVKKL
jgi:hypothetical protein